MPPRAAVTFTVTVQVPGITLLPAGITPPVNVTEPVPATAITPPPHVLEAFGTAAITTPGGNESVSGAVKVVAVLLGLPKVIVSVEIPPAFIVGGLNALLSVGVQNAAETALVSIVTAPVRAKALPDKVVLVVKVMLASARMSPTNAVAVPRVAELPTCQNALQF